jgi:hypothetical protein
MIYKAGLYSYPPTTHLCSVPLPTASSSRRLCIPRCHIDLTALLTPRKSFFFRPACNLGLTYFLPTDLLIISNVDKMTTNHNLESNSSSAQQELHFEQYNEEPMECPGAPKIDSFECFEGPFVMDDELLARYGLGHYSPILSSIEDYHTEAEDNDNTRPLFGLHPDICTWFATPFGTIDDDLDRNAMTCPGAPKIPCSPHFERPSIVTDEVFTYCGISRRSPILPLKDTPHTDDEDNYSTEGIFGVYPDTYSSTMVCPGAPKLPFVDHFEGPLFIDDELRAHYDLYSRSPIPSSGDYHFDNDENDNSRPLFGLFPELSNSSATHCRRVGHVRRDSDEFSSGSSATSPALSTPPASEFSHGGDLGSSEKEVELSSDLVIVGEPAIISRDEQP